MGIPNSKIGKEIPNDELPEGRLPSTPILTPKISRNQELDPRSPSLHIARTPLELLTAAAEKLEPYDLETPTRNKQLTIGVDPRSPTTDFKRTPIIISSPSGDLLRKLHNKNLDKARLAEIQATTASNVKTSVPPRLLESSPIKSRPDALKRRSLVGLLETNIDYTETDLDSVLQDKCKIVEDIDQKENLDENDENLIPIDVSNDENCLEQGDFHNKILEETQKVESVESLEEEIVENIAIAVPEDVKVQMSVVNDKQYDNEVLDVSDGCIELIAEASTSPTTALSSILYPKEIKSDPVTPSYVNLTADVKELDKKLTNLIYEEDLVVCPRIVQLRENVERSPLKNRNRNEFAVKNTQKLKVSDKPRRSDYVVSKIPLFKENRGKIKNQVQCENTPPRNMDRMKRNGKSNWDNKDTTLYL